MYKIKSEIADNPIFQRYYEIWNQNPSSVVFAPLAEFLIMNKCYEEAITICKEGLKHNSNLVSGRLAMAKAYYMNGDYEDARYHANEILKELPGHNAALEIVEKSKLPGGGKDDFKLRSRKVNLKKSNFEKEKPSYWNTATMAEIFAKQGNLSRAREIYNKILERRPDDAAAKEGLKKLEDFAANSPDGG